MNKGAPKKKDEVININLYAALVVAITFVLLLAAVITLCVCLAVNSGSDEGIGNGGGGGGGGVKQPVSMSELPVSSTITAGRQTNMILPSTAPSKNYLSDKSSSVQAIDNISSECAILVELTGNTSVAEKNADVVIHPASMSKLMTLIVACENIKDPNALLTIKKEMFDRRKELKASGLLSDSIGTSEGESLTSDYMVGKTITVEDALHLINYQSDTVACLLVAEYVAGSEMKFVDMMNQKAQSLGLSNTKFVNCTGLTEKDGTYNTSTCREIAAIMACAAENKVACDIVTCYNKYDRYVVCIYDENGQETGYHIPFYASWCAENYNLGFNRSVGNVEILGGKTGSEDISSYCFVTYGVNKKTGVKYICVTVGKQISSSGSGVTTAQRVADLRAIYKNYAN